MGHKLFNGHTLLHQKRIELLILFMKCILDFPDAVEQVLYLLKRLGVKNCQQNHIKINSYYKTHYVIT